ncbi:phospholipase A [Sphingomonas immobilis]|uniref:Phospholipase A1 n=1 Tax=Sphingomonas immobilis TaxID=3063997 RepID=A0ABT8ZWX3_9SPHN|nr:phospholipase A [Sphingomonas sp. CA1-15]MDO7841639.1 phospholipase A [Sphingomonas sp. CA1-15]
MRASWIVFGAAACAATPAAAQIRPLVEPPASAAAARAGVEVFLLNEGDAPVAAEGPAEIETVARDGSRLRLIAAPDGEGPIAPGKFARVHYRLAAAAPARAEASATKEQDAALAEAAAMLDTSKPAETAIVSARGESSAFVDRFRPYEPTYGVFGTGSDGAKLQVSFAFRALGHDDGPHLDFAYTQTMFWATNLPSGPFRATIYNPDLYVAVPLSETAQASIGFRHDSNGGGVTDSVDMNRPYLRVSKDFALGDGWRLNLTPQAWFFVGSKGVATDIADYVGYTALTASIGKQDGLKLSVTGRGNFATGRGAAEAFLSYPLAAIDDRLPHLYLFGQAFTGYGEALEDYRRNVTRVRFGIALTR